jgi:hypothetical protein
MQRQLVVQKDELDRGLLANSEAEGSLMIGVL